MSQPLTMRNKVESTYCDETVVACLISKSKVIWTSISVVLMVYLWHIKIKEELSGVPDLCSLRIPGFSLLPTEVKITGS